MIKMANDNTKLQRPRRLDSDAAADYLGVSRATLRKVRPVTVE
jgi:hypothetical protein